MFKDRNTSLRDHYGRDAGRLDRDKPKVQKIGEQAAKPAVKLA